MRDRVRAGKSGFLGGSGNPCPVCLGKDFEFVVGLNPKVVLKCERCGFVKEVAPQADTNALPRTHKI